MNLRLLKTSKPVIDWDLTALSAQNMIYRAFEKYVAVLNMKLMSKFKILHGGNTTK